MQRRHLPIEQKKKVFNEWGAVLRQQDEVENRVTQEQLQQQRALQYAFKANLDDQRARREQEVQANKERDRSEDADMMRVQAQFDHQRHATEEKKRSEIRQNVRQKAKESIEEKEKLREMNKVREEDQRNDERRRYLDEQRAAADFKQM